MNKPTKDFFKLKELCFFNFFVSSFLRGSILILLLALAVGCSKGKSSIAELTDDAQVTQVAVKDLPETVPAYGVVAGGSLEVNLEKEDGPRVAQGQSAVASIGSTGKPVECRVSGVLRDVNTATGQAIAWLKPVSPVELPAGEFVSSEITVGLRRHVLAVPREAVLIKDGHTFVIQKREGEKKEGVSPFSSVEVKTGISSEKEVEILSGLKAMDLVVTQGGIGYLYPDFKQSGEEGGDKDD